MEAAEIGATLCVVVTDTGRHAEDAATAAEHGLDVLVEKPLRSTAPEDVGCATRWARVGAASLQGMYSDSLNHLICFGNFARASVRCIQ